MSKSARWAWVISVVAATGAVLVLTFLLSVAAPDRSFYERNFVWLFWVNVTVAALLLLVIGVAYIRLLVRRRRGKFGSRLLFKLVGVFALVGVMPGVLIYGVSYQFVSRSIEAWFDVRVEGALDAGLNLGKSTLDAMVADLADKARTGSERLAEPGATPITALTLERLREGMAVQQIALLDTTGQIIASSSAADYVAAPERPAPSLLRKARVAHVASQLEGLDDDPPPAAGQAAPPPQARVRAVALVPSTSVSLMAADHYLLLVQPVPTALSTNALAVQAAYREYQQRALARDGLRKMYIGTLTLTLILAVFGAVLLAVVLGNQLARPLLVLADGMRQVARGDLSRTPVVKSKDELGGLTRSFADMTELLADAREQVQRGVRELESARLNLQTILDNLTTGVIVFDAQGRIETVNPGATRILKLPATGYQGLTLQEVPGLSDFARQVADRFSHQTGAEPTEHWQDAFELPTSADGGITTLLLRGAPLPPEGRLLVFDDISEVVSAQRSAAWGEVARRLAHEIKNPLTPIQLSAERLQHKLESRLEGAEQAMLVRSVATIVNQVQAMKQLVNEFRDYARLPAAQLKPLDLNALVAEVLTLYATAQEQGRLQAQCEPGLPEIMGDATQLRQVIHNLVQNALDAVAESPQGRVSVTTAATRVDGGALRAVRLKVADNGPGFPDKVLKRAFEPYVTTKTKGTGLGLAVVKKIADEHGARVRVSNLPGPETGGEGDTPSVGGAQVSLSFSNFAPVTANSAQIAAADAASDQTPGDHPQAH